MYKIYTYIQCKYMETNKVTRKTLYPRIALLAKTARAKTSQIYRSSFKGDIILRCLFTQNTGTKLYILVFHKKYETLK